MSPERRRVVVQAVLALLLLAALLGLAAIIDAVWSPAGAQHPTVGPDPYVGLSNRRGQGCCHSADCEASSYCPLPGGEIGVTHGGGCFPVPEHAIMPSIDNGLHACKALNDALPRCVLVPGDS